MRCRNRCHKQVSGEQLTKSQEHVLNTAASRSVCNCQRDCVTTDIAHRGICTFIRKLCTNLVWFAGRISTRNSLCSKEYCAKNACSTEAILPERLLILMATDFHWIFTALPSSGASEFPVWPRTLITTHHTYVCFNSALTLWRRSLSKCYLRIQSVPQREHHTSQLQRSTG
jgi:hypothetical protein